MSFPPLDASIRIFHIDSGHRPLRESDTSRVAGRPPGRNARKL